MIPEVFMPLFLNNDDIEQVITMKDTMEALEVLYRELGEGIAVGAPRSDLHVPTAAAKNAEAPMAHYLKSMSGASPHFGTAALRFSSDIVTWRSAGDGIRREKLPTMPGNRWLGIVMLFSSENGELLAIMNDGVLLAIVFAGDHDAEFVINLKEDDRHHQRAGQIEGVILCEGEIVRHGEAPVLWRGPSPLDRRRRVQGRPRSPRRRSRRGRTLA